MGKFQLCLIILFVLSVPGPTNAQRIESATTDAESHHAGEYSSYSKENAAGKKSGTHRSESDVGTDKGISAPDHLVITSTAVREAMVPIINLILSDSKTDTPPIVPIIQPILLN